MNHHLVYIDHDQAQLLPIDPLDEGFAVAAAAYELRPRAGATRARDDVFLGKVCEALGSSGGVLIVGPAASTSEFVDYLREHAPDAAARIVGVAAAETPNDPQIKGHAWRAFHAHRLSPAPLSRLRD